MVIIEDVSNDFGFFAVNRFWFKVGCIPQYGGVGLKSNQACKKRNN
jgi:hypothetical protein